MAAYFLFDNVEVSDPAALAEYAEKTAGLVAEHGGRSVAIDHAPEVVEGDPGLRSVLKAIRHRAVKNNAVLIAG